MGLPMTSDWELLKVFMLKAGREVQQEILSFVPQGTGQGGGSDPRVTS